MAAFPDETQVVKTLQELLPEIDRCSAVFLGTTKLNV